MRRLRQATDFHLLDEYRTSQTCPNCLKPWVKKHYPGDEHPCYKIKWCPSCELVSHAIQQYFAHFDLIVLVMAMGHLQQSNVTFSLQLEGGLLNKQ